QKKGYTCHAPLYQGHGVPPEKLLETNSSLWWQDVTEAYGKLKEDGHEDIAVVGLSLGGVFSLKLGYTFPVKGIVSMCAPMNMKNQQRLYQGVMQYAREYKQYEGKPK